jgi:hypothetical protein
MKSRFVWLIIRLVCLILLTPAFVNGLNEAIGKEAGLGIMGLIWVCVILYLFGEILIRKKSDE